MVKQITEQEILEDLEDQKTVQRDEVEIEPSDSGSDDEISPPMTDLLSLSEEQQKDLHDQVFKHFEILKEERAEEGIDDKWNDLEAQYDGEVEEEPGVEFNLNVPVTQTKCDAVERLMIKAYLESDPKYICQLRPEAIRQGMTNEEIDIINNAQEDYLDYLLDERIDIVSPLRKVVHQAVVLKGGIMKIPYTYRRDRKVREEFYSGKKSIVDGVETPVGLRAFLDNYPEAMIEGQQGHEYFKQLAEFEDVRFKATYWETVYDNTEPKFVDCRDFYARLSVEGYKGLCREQIIIERVRYTYWEMQQMEKEGSMVNVDEMKYTTAEDADKGTSRDFDPDYQLKEHNVLEATYYFDIDGEHTKIICRFGEENEVFLGAFEYPYDNVECIYLPFYIRDKKPGLWKTGLAEELTQSNMAQNALLNMGLTEIWHNLVETPIVKEGTSLADQIMGHNFRSGVPMTVKENEDINEILGYFGNDRSRGNVTTNLVQIMTYLGRMDDDRTGVNSGLSGKENPMDPNAPAAKTAMLLRQSGINIEEYINCALPSFNMMAEIILKLEHQMATSGARYRNKQRAGRVTGNQVFGEIKRDDMILEIVIQSRAASFAFDKIAEKQEDSVLLQMMRNDPLFARYPKAIRKMWISVLESWSPKWKALSREMALSNAEFDEQLTGLAVKALDEYMKELDQFAQNTDAPQSGDMQQLKARIQDMLQRTFSPTKEQMEGKA